MKIGILTFHCAANYGAVLQAYGLQETLRHLGHEAYIIDYRPGYLISPYKSWSHQAAPTTIGTLKNFMRATSVYNIRKARNKQFSTFVKQNLRLLPLTKLKDMDAIIVGSDQIWNPFITGGKFDEYYTLKRVDSSQLKIAYAASAGDVITFKRKFDNGIIDALNKFDAISVREKSLGEFLLQNGINVESVVLDPVLLSDTSVFDALTDKSLTPQEPYLLYFTLIHSKKLSAFAKKLAKEKGLRFIECCSGDESALAPRIIQTASINKFLSLLKYSAFTVTSSFHGTAFSTLFNKDFISVSSNHQSGERAQSLLTALGISERLMLIDNIQSDLSPIDYEKVNSKLNEQKNRSRSYLTNAINPIRV